MEEKEFSFELSNITEDILYINVIGYIEWDGAKQLKEILGQQIPRYEYTILDLSEAEYISSMGVGKIIEQSIVNPNKFSLVISKDNLILHTIIVNLSLPKLLPVYENIEDATSKRGRL